jgi:hypothetical protein
MPRGYMRRQETDTETLPALAPTMRATPDAARLHEWQRRNGFTDRGAAAGVVGKRIPPAEDRAGAAVGADRAARDVHRCAPPPMARDRRDGRRARQIERRAPLVLQAVLQPLFAPEPEMDLEDRQCGGQDRAGGSLAHRAPVPALPERPLLQLTLKPDDLPKARTVD